MVISLLEKHNLSAMCRIVYRWCFVVFHSILISDVNRLITSIVHCKWLLTVTRCLLNYGRNISRNLPNENLLRCVDFVTTGVEHVSCEQISCLEEIFVQQWILLLRKHVFVCSCGNKTKVMAVNYFYVQVAQQQM